MTARFLRLLRAAPPQLFFTNVPQAWAAGSAFALLQAMLGILPHEPRGHLCVDPHLPDWLPDVMLLDLRLGDRVFDIRFWREGDSTRFEVLRGDPHAVETRSVVLASDLLRQGP